jgi:hypothetical protein
VKKLFATILTTIAGLALAPTAFAQANINPCDGAAATGIGSILCKFSGSNGESVGSTIRNVVVFFIVIAIVVSLVYLLYGGIKWITSKGDKAEVEAARNHIMAAIIGLIIVILAVFIMTIVLMAFGISWTNVTIPTLGTT